MIQNAQRTWPMTKPKFTKQKQFVFTPEGYRVTNRRGADQRQNRGPEKSIWHEHVRINKRRGRAYHLPDAGGKGRRAKALPW